MSRRWELLKVVRQQGVGGIIKWQSSDDIGKLWLIYDEWHAEIKVVLKLKDAFSKEQILEHTPEKIIRGKFVKGQVLGSTLAFKYRLTEENTDVQFQVKFRWEFEARDCQQILSPYILWSIKQTTSQFSQFSEDTQVEARTQMSMKSQVPLPASQEQLLMPPPPNVARISQSHNDSVFINSNNATNTVCIPGLSPDISMRILQVIQRGVVAKQDHSAQTDISLLQIDLLDLPSGQVSDDKLSRIIQYCLEDKQFPEFCQSIERIWFDMIQLNKL